MARKKGSGTAVKAVLILLIFVMIAVTGLVIWLCVNMASQPPVPEAPAVSAPPVLTAPTQPETEPTTEETTLPQGPQVVSSATIGSTGDLLMHVQLINTSRVEGGYDFSPIFQYLAPYIRDLDYASANLETTFGGTGSPYQGNPLFNCPDPLAENLRDIGFDMMLTANNHCGDTRADGIVRTVETVRASGMEALGTFLDGDEPRYTVVEVNGIKLGMISYTYATGVTGDGRPSLNHNTALAKSGIVNFFHPNNLNKFYEELQGNLDDMKAEGAEATIVYLHWGTEYERSQNSTQRAIAQKLCDMGVDAIVGGHPHVVQPVELLSGTEDESHKTLVLYSMGNAVSAQRREKMRLKTGHTEDGLLYTMTFDKYDDGSVRLGGASVLPTWTQVLGTTDNPKGYRILPLDDSRREEWGALFEVEGKTLDELTNSYNRTMDLVSLGLHQVEEYLAARENP